MSGECKFTLKKKSNPYCEAFEGLSGKRELTQCCCWLIAPLSKQAQEFCAQMGITDPLYLLDMCVFVCGEREREREDNSWYVCVCVWREREREDNCLMK
jgi:hypothetical protein